VLPVVSLPIKVSGRNMLWRRMVINDIRSDPASNGGNYTKPPTGWLRGYEILRMMIDGVPHLQAIVPDGQAADQFIEDARKQAEAIDANDILYSLKSSASLRRKLLRVNQRHDSGDDPDKSRKSDSDPDPCIFCGRQDPHLHDHGSQRQRAAD
jgi:hypothetical protein